MILTCTATPPLQTAAAIHIRTATEPLEISQLRAQLEAEIVLKAGRSAGYARRISGRLKK